MRRTEVIVVGAGPTGLFLAGELALREVRVTVLERLEEPDPTVKGGLINVAAAEILDRRGLLPAAEEIQRRFLESAAASVGTGTHRAVRRFADEDGRASRRFPVAGHFAGMPFRPELVDQDDPLLAGHTAVAGGVMVPQHELERLLAGHCAALGVEPRRGVEVRGVRATDGGVVVETGAGELSADWVVAADGGRSVVRKRLGIDFVGTDPRLAGYQAIADFEDPGLLSPGWTLTPRGMYSYGPFPGRIAVARFGPQPADRHAPVSPGELQSVLREVAGVPVTVTALRGRATRWSDHARQARSYRSGRVLLAGDAAHVHSPFGGQGLSLGLGDAVNLGWKLAATVRGRAPDGLLDTYESERHPIGAWVLDWTRAQAALMRGDEPTARLRELVGEELLTVPGVMNRLVALASGITQRYDVADGAAPPVGSIAGDVALASGGRLADHAHDGRFVLVDRSPDGRFAAPARPYDDHVAYVPDPGSGASPSLLVRPDGVIAWAAVPGAAPSGGDARARLRTAIGRWIGAR